MFQTVFTKKKRELGMNNKIELKQFSTITLEILYMHIRFHGSHQIATIILSAKKLIKILYFHVSVNCIDVETM